MWMLAQMGDIAGGQTDVEFTKWLITLGVGGILAGFMFVFYRKDVKAYTDLWKAVSEQLMTVVKENTASNTKLISLIENIERNAMRRADVEALVDKRIHDSDSNRKLVGGS